MGIILIKVIKGADCLPVTIDKEMSKRIDRQKTYESLFTPMPAFTKHHEIACACRIEIDKVW